MNSKNKEQMENKHLSIVGFGRDRAEADFYPTPRSTTLALMRREKFDGEVWECASGDGAMVKAIVEGDKNILIHASDIRGDENIFGDKNTDFLKTRRITDNIITNPPYRYAKEFVLHAKECARKKVAMLLKLVFLEGINRYNMFKDKEFPLKKVLVFCRRQKIYKNGIIGKNSGLIAYAWFIWDKDYKGEPTIDWIQS